MNNRSSVLGAMALAVACSAPCVRAAAGPDVQVLVLGSYHFGNPGRDIANAKVDDVLSPRRQAELQALTRRLAKYQPTKLMVEREADQFPGQQLPAYTAWRAGQRREERNEVEQIGYRLAEYMGHEAVYGVDADGDFPFDAVQGFAKQHGMEAQVQTQLDALQQRSKAFEQRQAQASIGQLLAEFNQPRAILQDHQFHSIALRYGSGAEQPGAELYGQWALRNARICARIVQLSRPGDRILVLFGAGHSYWLRQCVLEQPGWKLVEALPYLQGRR